MKKLKDKKLKKYVEKFNPEIEVKLNYLLLVSVAIFLSILFIIAISCLFV